MSHPGGYHQQVPTPVTIEGPPMHARNSTYGTPMRAITQHSLVIRPVQSPGYYTSVDGGGMAIHGGHGEWTGPTSSGGPFRYPRIARPVNVRRGVIINQGGKSFYRVPNQFAMKSLRERELEQAIEREEANLPNERKTLENFASKLNELSSNFNKEVSENRLAGARTLSSVSSMTKEERQEVQRLLTLPSNLAQSDKDDWAMDVSKSLLTYVVDTVCSRDKQHGWHAALLRKIRPSPNVAVGLGMKGRQRLPLAAQPFRVNSYPNLAPSKPENPLVTERVKAMSRNINAYRQNFELGVEKANKFVKETKTGTYSCMAFTSLFNRIGAEKREPEMKIENVFDHNEFDAQHHGAFHDASFGLNDGLVDLDGNILVHGDILYHSEDEDGTESGDSTMCDDFSDFGNYAQPSANDFINQQVEERLRQQKAQAQIEEEIRQRKEEQQAAHEQRMSALNVQQQQLQVQRYGPVSSDVRHSARRTAASRRLKYDDEVQLGVADGAVIYPAIRPNGIAIIPPKIDQKAKPGRPSNKDRQRFVREGLAMCKKMGLDPAKLRPTDYIDLYGKQCHCDTPYNRKKCYIACESCQKWYHTKCVNLTEKKARKLTEWDCQACRGESFPVSTVEGGDQASSAVRKQPQAAAATTTTEEEDSRCQKCGQIESPHGYDFYVACDSCDKWYHAACVGIKKEEAETTSFVCYKCLIEPVRKLKEGYKFPLAEALQVIQKARNAFEECKDQNICKIVRSLDFDVFIDRLHVSTYDQFAAEFKEHFESQHVGITDKSQGYKSAMDSVSQWVVTELYKNHLPQLAKGQQY